jgi:hypothetical protein
MTPEEFFREAERALALCKGRGFDAGVDLFAEKISRLAARIKAGACRQKVRRLKLAPLSVEDLAEAGRIVARRRNGRG